MRARLALLAALVLVAGCSSRERLNPFDLRNPYTRGRPEGFVALADDAQVRLEWQPETGSDLAGFQVYRQLGGIGPFVSITGVLSSLTSSFTDRGLANGVDHAYRLVFVFRSGEGSAPAEAIATPGPLRPWVADFGAGVLARITADGRHVLSRVRGFDSPSGVAVDAATRKVWFTDTGGGSLILYDPSGTSQPLSIYVSGQPGAVVTDSVDHTAWACEPERGRLFHFNDGGLEASPTIGLIDRPIGIARLPSDRSVVVCERGGNRLRRFASDGTPLWGVPLPAPSRVAVDSSTLELWVTSFDLGRVVRLSAAGVALDSVGGFDGPIGVAVDARRGRIWVADARAGELVALTRGGAVVLRVSGLSEVREVAVDPASGDVWATVPGAKAVVRVTADGTRRWQAGGLSLPDGIALDPGR